MEMIRHYSEADLLETYYTRSGESLPVMTHIADCETCAARYERLQKKLRDAAACSMERPATFWQRQRLSILRTIAERRIAGSGARRTWRIAAAAVLAFLLGGAVVYKSVEPKLTKPAVKVVAPKTEEELQTLRDPWDSDELQDLRAVVQWESWEASS